MEKRTININVNTGTAQKDIDKIVDLLKEMNVNLDNLGKTGEDGFKELSDSAKKSKKSLLSFGNLFKAGGVFALAEKVLGFVTDAFRNTQLGADLLQVSQEALSRVMNDFFNLIGSNVGAITGFFKRIFDDPLESIKAFGQAIWDNLTERLNSLLDTLGYLAQAVKRVIAGDFTGALKLVKEAGKESIDVLTGVNDSFDKGTEIVEKNKNAIVEYGKEVLSSARNSVKLQREAEKLEAINQGLIESYDIQAESLRQIRDDETKSIDDRIKANEELKIVLQEQERAMKENAQAIVDAAEARFRATGLQEDEIALIQARNELSAVEATVTGFMSEQLINENALRKERVEIMKEFQLIGKSEFERQRTEAEQLREQRILDIEREVEDEGLRKELLLAVEQDYRTQIGDINQAEKDEQEKKRQEDFAREQAVTEAKIGLAQGALGALQGLAKEGSAASKALAVGQVILDAYKAIQATFANASANPSTILFPGYPAIQAGIAAVTAFANVKKILSVNPEKPSGATSPSQPSAPTRPSFNVVGASPENQLAEVIGDKEQEPMKAYVVSSDVSTAQALDRNIVENASL